MSDDRKQEQNEQKQKAEKKPAAPSKERKDEIRKEIAELVKRIETLDEVKAIRNQIAELEKELNGGKETQLQKAQREREEAKNIIEEIRNIPAKQRTKEQKFAYADAMDRKKRANNAIEAALARGYRKTADRLKKEAIWENFEKNGIKTENAAKEILRLWKSCKAAGISTPDELKARLENKT